MTEDRLNELKKMDYILIYSDEDRDGNNHFLTSKMDYNGLIKHILYQRNHPRKPSRYEQDFPDLILAGTYEQLSYSDTSDLEDIAESQLKDYNELNSKIEEYRMCVYRSDGLNQRREFLKAYQKRLESINGLTMEGQLSLDIMVKDAEDDFWENYNKTQSIEKEIKDNVESHRYLKDISMEVNPWILGKND